MAKVNYLLCVRHVSMVHWGNSRCGGYTKADWGKQLFFCYFAGGIELFARLAGARRQYDGFWQYKIAGIGCFENEY